MSRPILEETHDSNYFVDSSARALYEREKTEKDGNCCHQFYVIFRQQALYYDKRQVCGKLNEPVSNIFYVIDLISFDAVENNSH